MIVPFDGIGVFGPGTGMTLDANGSFIIPGLGLPAVPIGINATIQVAYLDPTSPIGIRVTWARFPESI